MENLKDSGSRRIFETGAQRDIADGKGRCDLMPLEILGDWIGDEILKHLGRFIYKGWTSDLYWCLDTMSIAYDGGKYGLILETAKHFERGANKYKERNWEIGIPLHSYIDSAARHYLKWCRGDKDEPHDVAFCWNIMCALWTLENKPELNDLPFGVRNESYADSVNPKPNTDNQ